MSPALLPDGMRPQMLFEHSSDFPPGCHTTRGCQKLVASVICALGRVGRIQETEGGNGSEPAVADLSRPFPKRRVDSVIGDPGDRTGGAHVCDLREGLCRDE